MAVIKKTFNVMALPLSIERANPIPVDSTAVWYSLEEMKTYATTAATAYVGQILTLVDEASNSATAYVIENATGDLKEVGSATLGDNKTVILGEDGSLALKNWGKEYYKWVDPVGKEGEAGYVAGHHVKQVVDAENPWIAGLEPKSIAGADGTFELAWYQPSTTTVEGLSSTVTSIKTSVDAINSALGDTATEGTIRYDIANKLDKAGGVMTGDITLTDGGKAISDTAVDTKIATAIGSAGHLKREIVEQLPEVASADKDTIYLVKDTTVTTGDAYKEYMLIGGELVQIGDTSVNLEPYATKAYADEKAGAVQTALDTHEADAVKHITAEERTAWNNKVDKAEGKSLISNDLITKVEGLANIKTIGDNLTLSEEGVLSAQDSYKLPIASTTALGGVMVDGATIKADETGKISVPKATAEADGLLAKEDFAKLQNIASGAQVNTVNGALVGDVAAEINEEKQIVIPVATGELFGVVKSSADADKIAIAEDGTMSANSYSTTKLFVPEGDELVLNGGNA